MRRWTLHRQPRYIEAGNAGHDDKLKQTTIADLWLDSPRRRSYDGIVFDPSNKDDKRYFNIFRGLAVQPKQGDWSLMRDHIYNIISSRNQEIFNYILAWIARIVQYPGGQRPGIALVLRGEQGVGKGIFVINIGAIFGMHFQRITNQIHLTGRFNNHLKNAIFVFVDEGVWGGDKSSEGVLKALITEDTQQCESKGQNAYTVKNHSNLVIASNNNWIVPAGHGERRFFVLDVSNDLQDAEYFYALSNQMDNGGREAMLYDLMHLDISEINLRKFPKTDALFDQIKQSMKGYVKFWYESIYNGQIGLSETWPEYCSIDNIYTLYDTFSKRLGIRYIGTPSEFGSNIMKLCPSIYRARKRVSGKQIWHYFIPSLEICRNDFETYMKMKISWDDGCKDNVVNIFNKAA